MNYGSNPHGFDRIPIIRRALWTLHSRIKAGDLQTDWPTFHIPSETPSRSDGDILYVQWIAKKVAQHYRLNNTTFIVCRNPLLDSAAQVEVRSANEIFVEFKKLDFGVETEIWAIMAHEIAHIFLNRLSLGFPDKLDNEVLTDTASIYLGFGTYFLSALWDEVSQVSHSGYKTTTHRIGYISANEAGYILSRRDRLVGENSSSAISSTPGHNGYMRGTQQFLHEQNRRPFIERSFLNRLVHRLNWRAPVVPELILLGCIVCSQPIRVPALHKTLMVKCPNCCATIRCFS